MGYRITSVGTCRRLIASDHVFILMSGAKKPRTEIGWGWEPDAHPAHPFKNVSLI